MEPLSQALALLRPRTSLLHALDAGREWAVRFAAYDGIKFLAVHHGACWLRVEGERTPHRLAEGDCSLLASGRPFVLSSDPALPGIDARDALTFDGGIARCRGGGACFLVGAHFAFDGDHADALFRDLPAVVPIRASSREAVVLRWAMDLFAHEIRELRPGGPLIAEHLAHIMLIQVLRLHLESPELPKLGWLAALGDPQLGAALRAMHAELRRRWTLDELARIAAMSRSSFADRFKRVVGTSPLEYLTRCRMHVAAQRLRSSDSPIAAIAGEVGYESESAFSTAFKKVYGHSPRSHRRFAAPAASDEGAPRPELFTART
jgi:AraC-like DNA-binding protein